MRTGWSLRAIRRARGLTLDELSALCGVSRDDLGLYERGRMTPRPGTVEKIARALDAPIVSVRQGMGWTAPEPAERWEAPEGPDPLREGVLEAVREACGPEFALGEEELRALVESVKAAIPALAERMKDTRPEAEIHRQLLREPSRSPEEEGPQCALTDRQWEQVAPLLPPERGGRGRAFKSNRLMLEGILFHLRSGTAWRDLPSRFGPYKCVSARLRLWQEAGVWPAAEARLRELGVLEEHAPKP